MSSRQEEVIGDWGGSWSRRGRCHVRTETHGVSAHHKGGGRVRLAGRGRKDPPLEPPRGSPALPAPALWTLASGTAGVSVLSHQVVGLLRGPYGTTGS